jgi:raffinose/stachyose/melibiose transport system permease protein
METRPATYPAPAPMSAKPSRSLKADTAVLYALLTLFALLCMYPIYFCLISSLKPNDVIFTSPYSLPTAIEWANYARAWRVGHVGQYFLNTVILTVCTLVVTGIVAAFAGYILSRFIFALKNAIYIYFIAGLMIPAQSTIIPLAYVFGKLGLNNNYPVMILLFTAFSIPMTVFILTGFMKAIPTEMEEAAIMDGATPLKVFRNIIFPMSVPALATVSIFNFIQTWNNLLFPLTFINDKSKSMISIGLISFFSERTDDYGGVMAAAIVTMLPPLIAYILLQEKVEKGLMAGAVKG